MKNDNETLEEMMKISLGVIDNKYGIELTWSEKLKLKHYIQSCKELYDQNILKENAHGAGIHLFMLDTFGLDTVTISKFNRSYYNPYNPEEMELYLIDSNIKKAKFQSYCKKHVQKWRDERELI